MSELKQRFLSAIVMAVVFLGAIYLGGMVFAALMTAIGLIIWLEWTNMSGAGADDRLRIFGLIALSLCGLALLLLSGSTLLFALVAIFAVTCGLCLSVQGGGYAVGGIFYAGLFIIAMVLLRGSMGFTPGLAAILYLCIIVWFTDIGAYFAGRALGGPKLAPAISPNKTISGALGGIVSAMIGALIVAGFFSGTHLVRFVVLAAFLSAVSQAGDLFESWMKRRSGTKDSGIFIPGHGGAMDRVDGLVFASISLWMIMSLSYNFAEPARAYF